MAKTTPQTTAKMIGLSFPEFDLMNKSYLLLIEFLLCALAILKTITKLIPDLRIIANSPIP